MADSQPERTPARTVADAMIHTPKTCGPDTTVAQARDALNDDHVHAVLIVDHGQLLAVVERPDLDGRPPGLPAHLTGRLDDRTTEPDADLQTAWRTMTDARRRRLAVTDDHGRLLGLLCLKRTGRGFCSDTDVQARAEEHRAKTP